MQSRQVGLILFGLYLVANHAPFQQLLDVTQAIDPSSEAEWYNAKNISGWRRRLQQATQSGAELLLWALVFKLNGLIPYPGSDRVWVMATSVLVVSSLVVRLFTERVFYTGDFEQQYETLPIAIDAALHLSIDASDLAVLALLLSLTTNKQWGSKWIHIGLLAFFGLVFLFVFVREWFQPKILGYKYNHHPDPTSKFCRYGKNRCTLKGYTSGWNDEVTQTTINDGAICQFCDGYGVQVLKWFGVTNDVGQTTIHEAGEGWDENNTLQATARDYYNGKPPASRLIYRIVLTVAIVMLANQPLW